MTVFIFVCRMTFAYTVNRVEPSANMPEAQNAEIVDIIESYVDFQK